MTGVQEFRISEFQESVYTSPRGYGVEANHTTPHHTIYHTGVCLKGCHRVNLSMISIRVATLIIASRFGRS